MCKEVFSLVEKMNLEDLETQMALQCAPLIMGIKMSNLLIVQNQNAVHVTALLKETAISCEILYQTKRKTTFLLYREEEVFEYLNVQKIKTAMHRFGYEEICLPTILNELSMRYHAYMNRREEFPHELGLLLGYPLEDVLGFIENRGQNYLYTGYWKVYANVEEAIALFTRFEQAKEQVIRMLSQGEEILNLLQMFEKSCHHQLAG